MDDGFDREFYRSRWQRVLPVGPHGIQPYVRAKRGAGATGPCSALRRLLATFASAIGVAYREGRRYQMRRPYARAPSLTATGGAHSRPARTC